MASFTFNDLTVERELPNETIYDREGWGTLKVDESILKLEAEQLIDALAPSLAERVGFIPRYHFTLNKDETSRGRNWHEDRHPSRGEAVPLKEITLLVALDYCPLGTIELIPGSHGRVAEMETLTALVGGWRAEAEPLLGPAIEAHLYDTGTPTYRPRLERGSAVYWHPWLWHRSDRGVNRKALVIRCRI